MREHKASNVEVVQYSYGIGFVYLLVVLTLTGNLMSGLRFCATVCSNIVFDLPPTLFLIKHKHLFLLHSIPFKHMVTRFYSAYPVIWVSSLY